MNDMLTLALKEKILTFLSEIGIPVKSAELEQTTFLPGITVANGVILMDDAKLLYPGDLLHEAGHLAVIPPDRRTSTQNNVGMKAAEEMMAIAWSYAALTHLKLEPSVVFHEHGYRGESEALIDNFSNGRYFGVPMLQWLGLTVDNKQAEVRGIEPFPVMIKWVLE